MHSLKKKIIKFITSKKGIIFTSFVFIAIVAVAFALPLQIPKFSGRIAYIRNENLRVRDYSQQRDYLLSKKIGHPEMISWSPLGKYLYTLKDRKISIFDLENKNTLDASTICDFTSIDEAKWTGRSDSLAIRDNNRFALCNLDGSKQNYSLELENNENVLDWVPINKNYIVVLVSNRENNLSKFLRLNLTENSLREIAVEKEDVAGVDNKYLWFAEDRNFVYITKGVVNRILLDESYDIIYKNSVKIGENIQPLGWNLDICVGGMVFIPESKFLVLDKNEGKTLVKQISFTAPQKYSSFEEDIKIERGETYWELAERIFGDGSRWKELYKYNTKREPTQLQIGSRLYVPSEEVKSFEDFQTIRNGDASVIYIPQLFALVSDNQVLFLTSGYKENEILNKFGPNPILFATKTTLQNEPRKFIVEKNRVVSIYSDIATKIDSIKGVDKAIWDWSNGYCFNHKYGEAIPSSPDISPDKRSCSDYMEIKQYGIQYRNICEEDWSEKIVNGVTILKNEKLGIEMNITRLATTIIPNSLSYQNDDGTKYDVKSLGNGRFEYKFYFKWKPETKIDALKIVCIESGGTQCEGIVPNFGWIP